MATTPIGLGGSAASLAATGSSSRISGGGTLRVAHPVFANRAVIASSVVSVFMVSFLRWC